MHDDACAEQEETQASQSHTSVVRSRAYRWPQPVHGEQWSAQRREEIN